MTNTSPIDRGRKLLEKCTLFSSLDEKARRDITAYAMPRSFAAGDSIMPVRRPRRQHDGGCCRPSAHLPAYALTKCELMFLERRNVIPFLERNPATRMKLMEILCARIRRSDERMSNIAFFNLPIRLAKTLLNYQPEARVGMKISLSQSELAEMAGGTREKVNRCLRDWQRQGIIELKNRWTIIRKPEALRALIESM